MNTEEASTEKKETSIKVSRDVHERLLEIKLTIKKDTGQFVSINDIIKLYLDSNDIEDII